MKSIISVLIVLLMAFALTACKEEAHSSAPAEPAAPATAAVQEQAPAEEGQAAVSDKAPAEEVQAQAEEGQAPAAPAEQK